MWSASGYSSSHGSNRTSPITTQGETTTEDATFADSAAATFAAASAAGSAWPTTAASTKHDSESPSSSKEFDVNELLAEPLYLDEYDSGHQHQQHHQHQPSG